MEASRSDPSSLASAIRRAIDENEAANDALRDYLAAHRETTRLVAEQILAGEDPWGALEAEDAAGRRDGYLDAWRRFEHSRQRIRMLVILWAKRRQGLSYRSMGRRLGVSPQMAARLGSEAAREFPEG